MAQPVLTSSFCLQQLAGTENKRSKTPKGNAAHEAVQPSAGATQVALLDNLLTMKQPVLMSCFSPAVARWSDAAVRVLPGQRCCQR